MRKRKKVFAIGDMHLPWVNRRVLAIIYQHIVWLKPDVIIQMGDLYDMWSWSRWPGTRNLITPVDEFRKGHQMAQKFWQAIRTDSPNARLIQLYGNHDDRAKRQVLSKAPEFECYVDDGLKKLFTFEGVETQKDSTTEVVIDDVMYIHGYLNKPGAHLDYSNGLNVVRAHSHKGGTITRVQGDQMGRRYKLVTELDCGYVGDHRAVPMSYAAQRRFGKYTHGYGWIDPLGLRFVPIGGL